MTESHAELRGLVCRDRFSDVTAASEMHPGDKPGLGVGALSSVGAPLLGPSLYCEARNPDLFISAWSQSPGFRPKEVHFKRRETLFCETETKLKGLFILREEGLSRTNSITAQEQLPP